MFYFSTSIGRNQVERDITIPQKADCVKDSNTQKNHLNSIRAIKGSGLNFIL